MTTRSTCEMQRDHDSIAPCGAPRAGITEDDVAVCRPCGKEMEAEGFRVDWDKTASDERQRGLFGGDS